MQNIKPLDPTEFDSVLELLQDIRNEATMLRQRVDKIMFLFEHIKEYDQTEWRYEARSTARNMIREAGIKQYVLASMIGIEANQLSKILNGHQKPYPGFFKKVEAAIAEITPPSCSSHLTIEKE